MSPLLLNGAGVAWTLGKEPLPNRLGWSRRVLLLGSHYPMLESYGQLRFPQSITCPIHTFKHFLLRLMHLPGIQFSYPIFLDSLIYCRCCSRKRFSPKKFLSVLKIWVAFWLHCGGDVAGDPTQIPKKGATSWLWRAQEWLNSIFNAGWHASLQLAKGALILKGFAVS